MGAQSSRCPSTTTAGPSSTQARSHDPWRDGQIRDSPSSARDNNIITLCVPTISESYTSVCPTDMDPSLGLGVTTLGAQASRCPSTTTAGSTAIQARSRDPCSDVNSCSAPSRVPANSVSTHCASTLSESYLLTRQEHRLRPPNSIRWAPGSPVTIDLALVTDITSALRKAVTQAHNDRDACLARVVATAGLPPWPPPASGNGIDVGRQHAIAALVNHRGLSLASTVALLRGETASDPRPNKALRPDFLRQVYGTYDHGELLISMAVEGVRVPMVGVPRRPPFLCNHTSARDSARVVASKIGSGQRDGTYLVSLRSTARLWPELICSPFGLVPKDGAPLDSDGRLVHDLSFPFGASVNSFTSQASLPDVTWRSVATIACHITAMAAAYPSVRLMGRCGDVKSAFRHLPTHRESVCAFGNISREHNAAVVDLALPFGWTGSPKFYGVVGNAMSWLLGQQSPASINPHVYTDTTPFFAYEWVDDHVLIEPDTPGRLESAELAFRLIVLATLGPEGLNEKKFPAWAPTFKALGLVWDLDAHTTTMPRDKLQKARLRVLTMLEGTRTTRRLLQQLLGSLRHVCSCVPQARPFFQRLHFAACRAPPFGYVLLSPDTRLDLEWFVVILQPARFTGIPTSFFAEPPVPDTHLYMDASDDALVVLDPNRRRFIRVVFDVEERAMIAAIKNQSKLNEPPTAFSGSSIGQFSTNCREFFSCVLGIAVWGSSLSLQSRGRTAHVQCHIDNTSGVSWAGSLASSNPYVQELTRCLGLHAIASKLHVSAVHIAGTANTMADAGSRPHSPHLQALWATMSADWTEDRVSPCLRHVYRTFSSNFAPQHWPQAPVPDTELRGHLGSSGANATAIDPGPIPTSSLHQDTDPSLNMSWPCGTKAMLDLPFSPSYAVSAGATSPSACPRSRFQPSKPVLSVGLSAAGQPTSSASLPRSISYSSSGPNASSPKPATERYGVLRSWATSFCCDGLSTYLRETTVGTSSE